MNAPGTLARPTRVAIVTNIPAPYRLPVYEALACEPGVALHVIFCSGREPDRDWDLATPRFEHQFLQQRFVTVAGRFVHANLDVWPALQAARPDVVVTTGFNPTHLLAFGWARRRGAVHVAMTDGTACSERSLTAAHRAVRRHVYARSAAFVGASEGSFDLYRSYGVRPSAMFKSHLCADNAAFARAVAGARDIDLMFCGRFVAGKQPLFALQVACATARRLGRRLRMLFVGSGEMDAALRHAAAQSAELVACEFAGFAMQAALPQHYARASVLLFPTLGDTWGVVANEACAAGVPVITTPAAGVAGELVRDGQSGRVLALDIAQWAEAAAELLSDHELRERMATRAVELVQPYNHANAAQGLAAAIRHALRGQSSHWQARLHAAAIVPEQQRPRVAIVQRRLTRYRVPLFQRLRTLLDARGVDLMVIVGDPLPSERTRGDDGHLDWALHVRCHYWLEGRLCWQSAWPLLRQADLAIVTQENKLMLNLLLATRRSRLPLALWGHGRNFQAGPLDRPSEWLKRRLTRQADWWFAYTELSRELVLRAGFAAQRITVLDNSDDAESLRASLAAVASESPADLRRGFGLGPGPVVLLLSSLHRSKRIDFQIEVAARARVDVTALQLLVVGDGPARESAEQAAAGASWIHWIGARTGRDKAVCLRMASAMLQTHGVGLVAVDSLVAGVPLVVARDGGHGPEFAYLRHDENCLVAGETSVETCAAALVRLLQEAELHERLARQCLADGARFGIEPMAQRFCDGILRALRGAPSLAPGLPESSLELRA